jgi:hypothetical protein
MRKNKSYICTPLNDKLSDEEIDENDIRKEMTTVWGQWWQYDEGMVANKRDELGIYELADRNKNTVYFGSGKVKTRLQDHLSKKECPRARFYRVDYYSSEKECRAQEQRLLDEYKKTHGKLPIYNERIG